MAAARNVPVRPAGCVGGRAMVLLPSMPSARPANHRFDDLMSASQTLICPPRCSGGQPDAPGPGGRMEPAKAPPP